MHPYDDQSITADVELPHSEEDAERSVKILCVIPARSGSKGVPGKNVREFNGKPLLAHSILQALASKYKKMMRVIVSTDSEEYARVARSYGAECPFLRPADISGDLATDVECMQHCLGWLKEFSAYVPDFVLHLRPTQPLRRVRDIDACIDIFLRIRSQFDSLRSVVPSTLSPFKMYVVNEDGNDVNGSFRKLEPLFRDTLGFSEPFNQARQSLLNAYVHNGYIDIVNTAVITKEGKMSGAKIFPFIMKQADTIDIDTEKDWEAAEHAAQVAHSL